MPMATSACALCKKTLDDCLFVNDVMPFSLETKSATENPDKVNAYELLGASIFYSPQGATGHTPMVATAIHGASCYNYCT